MEAPFPSEWHAIQLPRRCSTVVLTEVGPSTRDFTLLLRAWGEGDRQALDRLAPLVYQELHRLARGYMARERPNHTLQATALVNEAYLRLIDARQVQWQDRAHFLAVSARAMRQIRRDFPAALSVFIPGTPEFLGRWFSGPQISRTAAPRWT